MARSGRQLGKVGTTQPGGCSRVFWYSTCISGRSARQLKSPISTAFGWSDSSSAMKPSWDIREPAPSDRWATATARPSSPSPNLASSTPRPPMRPGRAWSCTSTGSSLLSSPLALDATPPMRRFGWWLQ